MSEAGKPPALNRSARYYATWGTLHLPIELSIPTMAAKISRACARTASGAAAAALAAAPLINNALKVKLTRRNPTIVITPPLSVVNCTRLLRPPTRITEPYESQCSKFSGRFAPGTTAVDDRRPGVRGGDDHPERDHRTLPARRWRHAPRQNFGLDGVGAALVALRTIVILTLVFPNYTVTTPGPYYAPSQLMLIAIVSLVIYGAFVFTQTIGHRQFFLRDIEVEEKGRLFACYWRILRISQPARRGFGNMHGSFLGEYR